MMVATGDFDGMDCATCRALMNARLDGTSSSEEARALEAHVSSCVSCRSEWTLLEAMDRALAEEPLVRAPVGFENAVTTEIIRSVEVRRRIESLLIPAACGTAAVGAAYGVHRLVNWEAVRSLVRGMGESANDAISPLAEPVVEGSGFLANWLQHPGVQGAMLAFAVVATIFLGVSAMRAVRQFTLEYRH
jgi:predicted anti-sigma-YlaC factor YlaD